MNEEEKKKQIIKEALKEWLDEKFLAFGRWSAISFAALALYAVIYFILKTNGWSMAQTPLNH